MVHVFNDPIDGAGQFSGFIQRIQVPEVSACFIAGKGMLNVAADRCVDVSSGGLIIPEGRVLRIHIFIIEGQFTCTQCAAVADILINAVNSKQAAVLPVWDKGCVDRFCPIIQFLVHCQPESQRIGS